MKNNNNNLIFFAILFITLGAGIVSGQIREVPRFEADSMESLRQADASAMDDGDTVWLRGYQKVGDGGQGRFRLDKSGELGDDAADGGIVIEAKGGEDWYWRRYHTPGRFEAAWFGILPDGEDVQPALEKLFRHASEVEDRPLIRINPGRYHLGKTLRVNHKVQVEGTGAFFDNTISFRSKNLWIKGLTVEGMKDGPGFHFHRAQKGVFVNLTARRCQDGFLFGGNEFNQVTLGTFIQPAALRNERHGFVLDGENKRNWVNQNVLLHPISRDNGGDGFITRAQTNYNVLIGAQSEGNGGIAVRDKGLENAWFGGHYVCMEDGVSFDGHWRSAIFGGRSRGEVAGADTVLMRAPIVPKARRLDNLYRISVDNLQVKGQAELPGYPKLASEEAVETRTKELKHNSGREHAVQIDLSKMNSGDTIFMDIIVQGAANRRGRLGQNFHLRAGASVFAHADGDQWTPQVEPQQESGCRIVRSHVSEDQKLILEFETEEVTQPNQVKVLVY